ncbi:glycosyltransferase [Penicillium sp. DV-2018c]|nr:glycosyltransferase [Penicillium sp. DV-2018c]
MHITFLTNPASGQVNVQLATAKQLVLDGHAVTFLSAESCRKKIDQFTSDQELCKQGLIRFISLGSGRTVDDFTSFMQDRMHLMRSPPGDPISLETCIEASLGSEEEQATTAVRVRDYLNALDPDMICVDALTPRLITGVLLTKRKYILTIPCSPGLTAISGAFEPHPMASNRDGSWGTLLENVYLNFRLYYHSVTHPGCVARQDLLSKRFGLKSYGIFNDLSLLPPLWEDKNCLAGIHFNTLGLIDHQRQSSKMVFVGAGISEDTSTHQTTCPELAWVDEATLLGEDVIYMNMGSMFIWERHEFWNCISGFEAVYRRRGGRVRFLFKINFPVDSHHRFSTDELPPYIRLTNWIENQHALYSHPALKVFIHHGGGNSFNEAVYFAVPQLVLSQWLDTHEYAIYAEQFGLGLRSERPPYVEAKDIEDKIMTLLGSLWPTFKSNCRTWAVRSQIGGGTEAAAKIILSHIETSSTDTAMLTPPMTPGASPIAEKQLPVY